MRQAWLGWQQQRCEGEVGGSWDLRWKDVVSLRCVCVSGGIWAEDSKFLFLDLITKGVALGGGVAQKPS